MKRLALVLTVVLVSCGAARPSESGSSSVPPTTSISPKPTVAPPPGAAVAPSPHAAPAPFNGTLAEFYVVPSPLPPDAPGALIRRMPVGTADGLTTERIMYHSRDALDRDRAVTGIVSYPTVAPPAAGWPVITLGNGTVGLASPCALSRSGHAAPTFGVQGVGVVSDYIGLGPVGETHPYLSRPSEGHSMIDAVRAARELPDAHAGDRWLAVGHSQGGHAALSTNELGAAYAPELHLLGTISLAPAAMFDRTYGPLDEIVARIVEVMGLYGGASEHPEVDPNDYVGPDTAAAAAAVFPTKCLGDIINAFLPIPADTFWTHEPVKTEPARSIILANDVGNVAVASPVLLISGTMDARVFVDRARDLYARMCANGQTTEYLELDGATHDDEYQRSASKMTAWLNDRLQGVAPVSSCTAAPSAGGPTAATAVPSSGQAALAVPVVATPQFAG